MKPQSQIQILAQSQVEPEQIKLNARIKTKPIAVKSEHESVEIRGVRVRGD